MGGAGAVWKLSVGQVGLAALEGATPVTVTVVDAVESGSQDYSQAWILVFLPCVLQDA